MAAMITANTPTQDPSVRARPGRAKRLTCALAVALPLIVAQAGSALAQEGSTGRSGGNLGVGVHAMLDGGGPFGPAIVYDTGIFHIEGLVGFADTDGATEFDVGGRFWYHINSSQSADFSLGGGLGVTSIDPEGEAEGTTDIEIDVGAQLRAFIVPNVALSASLGLAIITGDNDVISLTGDLTGAAGVTYFF